MKDTDQEFNNKEEEAMGEKIKLKEQHIYHGDLSGSFSWKTADTNESIPVYGSARDTFPVFLLCPGGSKIEEESYKGRGQFGGQDVNALLANWNWPEQCTGEPEKDAEIGRSNVWKYKDNVKYPIKLVRNPDLNYKDVSASEECEHDGWDYEIEDWPENSEILNKYSEEKVLAFYKEIGSALVEVHYPYTSEKKAEAIHFILSGYASDRVRMYMPKDYFSQSIPKDFYDESDLLIWIPEDDIFNFFQVMVDNENGFVIGNGGFVR